MMYSLSLGSLIVVVSMVFLVRLCYGWCRLSLSSWMVLWLFLVSSYIVSVVGIRVKSMLSSW